jgi:uncharacterized membrane protein (DUF4010 family)
MTNGLDLETVRNFGTALLIGTLVGIEREKRKELDRQVGIGGLRTFVLASLLGAIGGWLTSATQTIAPLLAVTAIVASLVLAGYVLAARARPDSLGITTETAAIVVCLLGAMTTMGHRPVAVALGIATAALLAYKQPLHGLVAKLDWDDIFAGLRLLVATFIVLPLLPSTPVDPWGALSPYSLWLLVLLISSLSLVGYVASRSLGADRGTVLTAVTGGLVSSTAVTLSFARQAHSGIQPGRAYTLASAMLVAWTIMFVRVVVLVLVVNRALVGELLMPFAVMGGLAAAAAAVCFHLGGSSGDGTTESRVALKNPFSLTEAAKFGAFFAIILLVVKIVQTRFPGQGLYMVAGLAGLTDVDAITLSMSEYARKGDTIVAANAIVIATLANTIVKVGIVTALADKASSRPVAIAAAVVVAAGCVAIGVR